MMNFTLANLIGSNFFTHITELNPSSHNTNLSWSKRATEKFLIISSCVWTLRFQCQCIAAPKVELDSWIDRVLTEPLFSLCCHDWTIIKQPHAMEILSSFFLSARDLNEKTWEVSRQSLRHSSCDNSCLPRSMPSLFTISSQSVIRHSTWLLMI